MTERSVLFVGGHLHGRRQTITGEPASVCHAVWYPKDRGPFYHPSIVDYWLRWYIAQGSDGEMTRNPAYVRPDGSRYGQGGDGAVASDLATADRLLEGIHPQHVPRCTAPTCMRNAPMMFTALERGRLGGREWAHGDEIRLCPDHANDIYEAQGIYGVDQLPKWLQPDSNLDPLDAYDGAFDALHQEEIARHRGRALRVRLGSDLRR